MRHLAHPVAWLAASLLVAAPAGQSLDAEAAAAYSDKHGGLAVLVYRDGELEFERYQNGHTADEPQHLFSGTKSFASIAALVAQHEGLLRLDEKVADTITEWRGDARRERITIRHLLDFTSGLENIDGELHSVRTPDKYAAAIACRGVHEPGVRFRYGSNHLLVFGALLERKLRAASTDERPLPKDFVGYFEARVLEPIGCRHASWLRDREGHPLLPYGAFMTAREWAKFGQLVLNGGRWGDAQIVPAEHLAECFAGSDANPVYGLNFWLVGKQTHRRDPAIPEDAVAAAGMYGQKLYIVPSRRLVIVRFGQAGVRAGFADLEFLGALFAPGDAAAEPSGAGAAGRRRGT
jgi:CubicO group peptidase (beta-lactamase class C family)